MRNCQVSISNARRINLAGRFLDDYPTGGCWNKIRHSAFYVITATGQLLVWDFLQTLRRPVFTLQLCNEELTCLAPCEEGVFLTIGNRAGDVFLVEPSEFFNSFDKTDRALYSEVMKHKSMEYVEQCQQNKRPRKYLISKIPKNCSTSKKLFGIMSFLCILNR